MKTCCKEGIPLNFIKMHGLGNDFVLVDGRKEIIENPGSVCRRICDRHTGVGADGFIIVLPSDRADIRMRYFNSDGSEGEMCGNGIRCFARFVVEQRIVKDTDFTVETLGGIMKPAVVMDSDGSIKSVVVDMGEPVFDPGRIPVNHVGDNFLEIPVDVGGECTRMSAVLMGVPHTVVFTDHIDRVNVEGLGMKVERHALFPAGTNVDFVQVWDRGRIKVRTWERGAGKTLACGTGCCAAVVVSSLLGKTDRKVKVELPLGSLLIEWRQNGHVYMEGPAEIICSGVWHGTAK